MEHLRHPPTRLQILPRPAHGHLPRARSRPGQILVLRSPGHRPLLRCEPFYVGFNVGGYELGLDPDPASGPGRPGWLDGLLGRGGRRDRVRAGCSRWARALHGAVREVGGGIKVGTVLDPFGNVFGVIENPHFSLPDPVMIYRARTLVPMGAPPVEDGAVAVRAEFIAGAGRWADVRHEFPTDEVIDLGEVALLPGLINAHCHLDYSGLRHAILPPNKLRGVGRDASTRSSVAWTTTITSPPSPGDFANRRAGAQTTILNIESFPGVDVEDGPAAAANLVVLRDDRRAPRHAHRGTRRRGAAVFSGSCRAGPRPGGLAGRHRAEPARALHRVRRDLYRLARRVRPGPRDALDDAPGRVRRRAGDVRARTRTAARFPRGHRPAHGRLRRTAGPRCAPCTTPAASGRSVMAVHLNEWEDPTISRWSRRVVRWPA